MNPTRYGPRGDEATTSITSATREGARVMRMADDIGTIEPGKLADLS